MFFACFVFARNQKLRDLFYTFVWRKKRSYTKAFGYKVASLYPNMHEGVWGLRTSQDHVSQFLKSFVFFEHIFHVCMRIDIGNYLGCQGGSLICVVSAFTKCRTPKQIKLAWVLQLPFPLWLLRGSMSGKMQTWNLSYATFGVTNLCTSLMTFVKLSIWTSEGHKNIPYTNVVVWRWILEI